MLRLSKKLYYEENFKKFRSNSKKTWELLNEVTGRVTDKIKIKEIITEGNRITDPKAIANNFNKFFTNVGEKISKSVEPTRSL